PARPPPGDPVSTTSPSATPRRPRGEGPESRLRSPRRFARASRGRRRRRGPCPSSDSGRGPPVPDHADPPSRAAIDPGDQRHEEVPLRHREQPGGQPGLSPGAGGPARPLPEDVVRLLPGAAGEGGRRGALTGEMNSPPARRVRGDGRPTGE